ncbi:MAG: iron-sulfur cluster-binding domain-containing protein [Oscillospiraceae bacterium]
MAKTIKETLLGTIVHGNEIMEEIRVLRQISTDKIKEGNEADLRIAQLHAKDLELVVSAITDTGKNAKILRLSSKNGYLPPFEAGQYVNLFTEIDGVRTSRPYSISSSPRQRAYYEITVAATKDGFVSDYFLNNVKTGDCFLANGPAGVFRFQPVFHSKKSLFLAGGSGITPFMSMLREIIDAGLDRDVVMLYGCRCEDAALYHDELCAYAAANDNFAYHLVVSDDAEKWKGEKGFINEELIKRLVPDFAERTCYICGPQIMNDFCKNELENMGMPIKRIRREMFGSRRDIQNEPGWPKELSGSEVFNIKVGERVIDAKSGESVLCALERAGIRVNVCCRSGECSLCRVKLVSGKVFLSKGIMLRMADEKFGYIHSCKAYPIGDIEISI